MKQSVKIGTLLSFGMLSTLFFSLAYVFVDEAVPLTGPDDLFFLAESALCLGLALWSLITVVGIARKRKWARVSAVWVGPTAILVYVLPLARYGYVAATTPDVGWSWLAILPLVAIVLLVIWWLVLFTRPEVKRAFSSPKDVES